MKLWRSWAPDLHTHATRCNLELDYVPVDIPEGYLLGKVPMVEHYTRLYQFGMGKTTPLDFAPLKESMVIDGHRFQVKLRT